MLDRLNAAVDRHCEGLISDTGVPRLTLISVDQPIGPIDQLYDPMICFVVSGAKRTDAGELIQSVQAGEMLLTKLYLPVVVALEKVPYRTAVMRLDGRMLAELLVELDETGPVAPSAAGGQVTTSMSPEVVDAVTRWVELLDTPHDIRPLASRVESEILYRLLRSSFGPALRQWSLADSTMTRMREVARWVCERYTEPLSIEAIAAVARMSPASLHRHFKATTGMSPVNYQKQLRLQEARRRLVVGGVTVAQAAQAVGYVSATQFNRDYRRRYGLPPGQDAARLRARPDRAIAAATAPA
ncbi:hypothetical protein SGFS_097690 [Streptomyces graminofaciens]|uniref:HTH araC/xylS-type domain-containing protein n=1 Tax=Streptomyces graminofaciens TaxID=68212 RepID=A0ABM7FPA5_9ACTN|nr:AraC family transcriptional regulator [Streptomyces graminofaciens]BBC38475.1 hypothetical protein SGFS_097690 [Streptomyces graminofaciens]